jgi:hypothetical protein
LYRKREDKKKRGNQLKDGNGRGRE